MAKRRRKKHKSFIDQVLYTANSRVFWVVFLALISFTFAFPQVFDVFRPQQGDRVVRRVFGEDVTEGELVSLGKDLEAVRSIVAAAMPPVSGLERLNPFVVRQLLEPTVQQAAGELVAGLNLVGRGDEFALDDAYIFLEEARRLGLRVTDAELSEVHRRLWRWGRARELAAEEVARDTLPAERGNFYRPMQLQSEYAQELRQDGAFDAKDWKAKIRSITGQNVGPFEQALRRVLLLAKLDDYVRSTVVVSDEEVYERFVERNHQRKLSWLPLEPAEGLREAVRESLDEDELRRYYESHEEDFFRPLAIGFDYLRVPFQPFEEEARESITEEDLRKEYEENLEDYRRTGIRPEEGFELLSKEEMEERRQELYRPFDEVKDEVRETLVAKKADRELRAFTERLKQRLYPAGGGDVRALAREAAKEHDFLVTGRMEPIPREEAEEVFGDLYNADVMPGWYTTVEREFDLSETQRAGLERAIRLPDDQGYVFYYDVRIRDAYQQEFDEARDQVVEAAVDAEVLDVLSDTAEEKAEAVEEGATSLADLAGTAVEVDVGDGAVASARFGEVGSTGRFIARYDQIEVAREPAEDEAEDATSEDGEEEEAEDGDGEDGGDEAEEAEVHPASQEIVQTGFSIEETGGAAVAVPARPESDALVAYVVTYDERLKPDPADFENQRARLESELIQERQRKYLQDWATDLRRRAYGVDPAEESGGVAATSASDSEV